MHTYNHKWVVEECRNNDDGILGKDEVKFLCILNYILRPIQLAL